MIDNAAARRGSTEKGFRDEPQCELMVAPDLMAAPATPDELEELLDGLDVEGLIASMTVECAGGCGASFVPRSRSQRTCGASRCRMRLLRAARRATS